MEVGFLVADVQTTGAMTSLAADVPFGHGPRLDVVVHRVTAVTQRTRRPLHLVVGVDIRPPIGPGPRRIRPPRLVLHVPLGRKDKVVVANLREVALLPLAAVGERHVFFLECDERVRLRKISDDGIRMLFRVPNHVGHQRGFPAAVDVAMAGFARGGADERLDAGVRWRRGDGDGAAGGNDHRAGERAPATDPEIRGQTVLRAFDEVTAFLRMRAVGFLMKTVERSTSHHGCPFWDHVACSENGGCLEKEPWQNRG